MGIVGLRLVMELRGVSCLDLEQCPPPKQALTCSRAFGKLISTLAEMEEAVSVYTSRRSEKLRRERLAATVLTVCLSTNKFKEGAVVQQRAHAEAAERYHQGMEDAISPTLSRIHNPLG